MGNYTVNQSIGDRMAFLQATFNISNKDFADKLGVDASTMSKIKQGVANIPYYMPEKLVELWKINLHWLFTGEGEWNIFPRETSEQQKSTGPMSQPLELGDFRPTIKDYFDYVKGQNLFLQRLCEVSLIKLTDGIEKLHVGQDAQHQQIMKALDILEKQPIGTNVAESDSVEFGMNQGLKIQRDKDKRENKRKPRKADKA